MTIAAVDPSPSDRPDHSDLLPPHLRDANLRVLVNDSVTHLSVRGAPAEKETFDDYQVVGTAAKITSVGNLELGGAVFKVGDMVKVVLEARVSGVDHVLDKTEQYLTRRHKLAAMDVAVVDWNIDLDALRNG